MPEFILDTSGAVRLPRDNSAGYWPVIWADLGPFTQGYIEALFFTETSSSMGVAEWRERQNEPDFDPGDSLPNDVGFGDLSPEALAKAMGDCRQFQTDASGPLLACSFLDDAPDEAQAGRDFWYTRNGHGCGFWDGDWPEPYATALDEAATAFGEVDVYLGDDGKVYLS